MLTALIRAVALAVTELQLATDDVDAAAAERLEVNRTDLRLLSLLDARGAMIAGQLAQALALTPASTTVAIQRLVAAGLVHREQHAEDRRRAVIDLTDHAREQIGQLYGPLGQEGGELLATYSKHDLQVVQRFLADSRALQQRHAERIRQAARVGT